MFGEAQWSSMQIKNASPNAKTYVLMEHNEVAEEKIIAAKSDNNLNEMFVLRKGKRRAKTSLEPDALLQYYKEISLAIKLAEIDDNVNKIGKLLDR